MAGCSTAEVTTWGTRMSRSRRACSTADAMAWLSLSDPQDVKTISSTGRIRACGPPAREPCRRRSCTARRRRGRSRGCRSAPRGKVPSRRPPRGRWGWWRCSLGTRSSGRLGRRADGAATAVGEGREASSSLRCISHATRGKPPKSAPARRPGVEGATSAGDAGETPTTPDEEEAEDALARITAPGRRGTRETTREGRRARSGPSGAVADDGSGEDARATADIDARGRNGALETPPAVVPRRGAGPQPRHLGRDDERVRLQRGSPRGLFAVVARRGAALLRGGAGRGREVAATLGAWRGGSGGDTPPPRLRSR